MSEKWMYFYFFFVCVVVCFPIIHNRVKHGIKGSRREKKENTTNWEERRKKKQTEKRRWENFGEKNSVVANVLSIFIHISILPSPISCHGAFFSTAFMGKKYGSHFEYAITAQKRVRQKQITLKTTNSSCGVYITYQTICFLQKKIFFPATDIATPLYGHAWLIIDLINFTCGWHFFLFSPSLFHSCTYIKKSNTLQSCCCLCSTTAVIFAVFFSLCLE